MKQRFNICHIYFGIIILCSLNDVLISPGTTIMRAIQTGFIMLSAYYAVIANIKYQLSSYFKALNVLVIMFTIYGFIMLLDGKQYYVGYSLVSKTNYLLITYMSLLPIYAFYVFAKKGFLTEKTMKIYFFVFLVIAIIQFINNHERMLQMALENGLYVEGFTNNVGYTFVGLLPALVLFNKKPLIQYVCLVICAYYIMIGMKRGAILAGGLCLIWFLVNNVKKVPNNRRWLVFLVSVLVLVSGVCYARYLMETSSYFQFRVEQTIGGDSSGRNELYNTIIQHVKQDDNVSHILFGNGANSTLIKIKQYAHNDWLSLAIEQGLLGIIIYLFYWICLYKEWRRSRYNPQAYMVIGMFLIIYFLTTLFSMSYNGVSRCAAMVLGYYMAIGFETADETTSVSEPKV